MICPICGATVPPSKPGAPPKVTCGMRECKQEHADKLASTWCSPRFGGDAANSQERYFHVMGFEALKRRRERATSLWFKFCFGEHL